MPAIVSVSVGTPFPYRDAEAFVESLGVRPGDVSEVRISGKGIEVDLLQVDENGKRYLSEDKHTGETGAAAERIRIPYLRD